MWQDLGTFPLGPSTKLFRVTRGFSYAPKEHIFSPENCPTVAKFSNSAWKGLGVCLAFRVLLLKKELGKWFWGCAWDYVYPVGIAFTEYLK